AGAHGRDEADGVESVDDGRIFSNRPDGISQLVRDVGREPGRGRDADPVLHVEIGVAELGGTGHIRQLAHRLVTGQRDRLEFAGPAEAECGAGAPGSEVDVSGGDGTHHVSGAVERNQFDLRGVDSRFGEELKRGVVAGAAPAYPTDGEVLRIFTRIGDDIVEIVITRVPTDDVDVRAFRELRDEGAVVPGVRHVRQQTLKSARPRAVG